jgi:hypothetical protein
MTQLIDRLCPNNAPESMKVLTEFQNFDVMLQHQAFVDHLWEHKYGHQA